MLKTIKMAALAATVTFTGMGYSAPSFAQDVEFMIGPGGLRVRQRDYCESERGRDDRRCRDYFRDRDGGRRGGGWEGRRRGCDADDAVEKAERMGLRRARVIDEGRRSIEVGGRSRRSGDRVSVTFGREPGCPVLDRDR